MTERNSDLNDAVRHLLDSVYLQASQQQSMESEVADQKQNRHLLPQICADLIDAEEFSEHDEDDDDGDDVDELFGAQQQEIYTKVKEDSLMQDRSLDTNQSARSGSTFSLPGSCQQRSFLSSQEGPSTGFLSLAWQTRPSSPRSYSGNELLVTIAPDLPQFGHAYESDGNYTQMRQAHQSSSGFVFGSLGALNKKLGAGAGRKGQAALHGGHHIHGNQDPSEGLNSAIDFTIEDASAEMIGGSSSVNTGSAGQHHMAHALFVKRATPGHDSTSAVGNRGGSSGGQHSLADTKFSMSAQGHFRPSFAFSSNWSSSGSEGHGRGSFFGRKRDSGTEQKDSLQLRRQTFQGSNKAHASQQSPHSIRGPGPVLQSTQRGAADSRVSHPLDALSAQAAQSEISRQATVTSTSYRSPRLSPLHKFDTMISDSNKKVHSEFPFAKRPTKNFKYEQSSMSFPVEVIEEDKAEGENQPKYERKNRFSEIVDYNEFGLTGKRYRSEEGRNRKKQRLQRGSQITSKIFNLPSAYVSETEDEEDSNESDVPPARNQRRGNKRALKVMSLGRLSQLINKQIYSDDFDKKSYKTEMSRRYKRRVGGPQSMADQPIDEDDEEIMNDYLSDCSSNSSQFSLRKRYLSLDLQKLIDKMEPMDDSSAVHSKYYGNVNETIEEEISDHDEEYDKKSKFSRSSKSSNQKRVKKGKGDHHLSFMSIISDRMRRARSHICELESETIAEELDECDYQGIQRSIIDENMHNFKVPARLRADSDGMIQQHQLGTIAPDQADSSGSDAIVGSVRVINDSISARAVFDEGPIAIRSAFSSGTEEEEKTPRSQRYHSSRPFHRQQNSQQSTKFHPAQLQAMKRFGTSSNSSHGKGKKHSTRSHHSGRNLSVSSLPTITEEGKTKRMPSMSQRNNKSCSCKKSSSLSTGQRRGNTGCCYCQKNRNDKLAMDSSKLRESNEEQKGHVAEAGIADEEDSSGDSGSQSGSAQSSAPSEERNQVARMPSRFFDSSGIQEAADTEEVDEISTVHRDESPNQCDTSQTELAKDSQFKAQ